MSHEAQIHKTQTAILRELLFKPSATFAELQKKTNLPADHFKFHLARLVELAYVGKREDGSYELTIKGKEYANRLDTDEHTVERQPKISVIIIGWRTREGTDQTEFIVQQRLKNPYFGYWARLGGKIRWGETVLEAAARELEEEVGMQADLEYKGLYHKMDYVEGTDTMLEDKFFLLVKATNFHGEFIEDFEGGHNAWLTHEEIDAQEKVFQGMREAFEYVNQDHITFTEQKLYYKQSDY